MAGVHLASLAASPLADVRGVAAPEASPEVRALSSRLGAPVHASAQELLSSGGLDAVVVATTTDTHAELVRRALEAGYAVFCEKPLVRHLAEAEHLAELAGDGSGDGNGAKVAVGHVVRYFPEYEAARGAVLDGSLGRVATARLRRVNASPAAGKPWYADAARSGGPLLDLAVHDLDWLLWTFGPAARIYARTAGPADAQVIAMVVRHRAGPISYLDVSWREQGFATSVEVAGTEAFFRASDSSAAGLEVEVLGGSGRDYLPAHGAGGVLTSDPYRLELDDSLAWFAGCPTPRAVLADGVASLRLALAVEVSLATGRPVRPEEVAP